MFWLAVANPLLAGASLRDNANAASFVWRAIRTCPFDPGESFEEGGVFLPRLALILLTGRIAGEVSIALALPF
ncbi:MAG: hypothetical protein MK364_17215 [Pirellulales bacterium]|nr:hypothetical protein [Pirellulales bacterium]